jgi:hypothetical protein
MFSFLSCRRLRLQIQYRCKPQTDKMCPSLPSSSFVCDICFEAKFLPIKLSNCSHYFCYRCIYQWAKSQLAVDAELEYPNCPTCRQEFDVASTLYPIGGKTYHRFISFMGENIPKGIEKMALAQVGFFYSTTFCNDFEEPAYGVYLVRCHYCSDEWNLAEFQSLTDLQAEHSRARPWCPFGMVITID